jgi:hypothetical protein
MSAKRLQRTILKKQKISFTEHPYDYLAYGSAQAVQCVLED